jgi:D-lactate dehydrogenase (cytochrome)
LSSPSYDHSVASTSTKRLDSIKSLQKQIPNAAFSYNRYDLDRHGKGESYHPTSPPDAVVTPSSLEEVRAVVRHCVQNRIPIVPFGAGTSVEGHVCALRGGVSLDMTQFQTVEIPSETAAEGSSSGVPDLYAVVGAGVTRKQLNRALRHTGLHFSVDPGADATLGGMVATGASGTTTIKYGGMRENILELQCVLADEDATVVQCGTRALKNSAGYDLLSLFCGSEGTLGVIVSITVKLHPLPECTVAATCQFSDLKSAAQAVAMLRFVGGGMLARCELLDPESVRAFNAYNPSDPSLHMIPKPTLFLEFQGPSSSVVNELVEATSDICKDVGGESFAFAADEEGRNRLWSARHTLYYASIAYRPGATGAIVTDCCVPLSEFARLIDETARDVLEHDVVGPCFGHAGDGNLHCILPIRDDDPPQYLDRVRAVQANLIDRTLKAGGTCTGEHGVGYGKIQYLERQYGPGAVRVMQSVKRALDPYSIMNPGKVVPL